MERMWQERADYGHFFYRIPNGESAADAYDRVSGFNESLWRQFGENDFASVCVLGRFFPFPLHVLASVLDWRELKKVGLRRVEVSSMNHEANNNTVTHGLMSRVFLMKWYHFSVEYFEDLRNVNHCEFLIMRKKEDSGKYILENNLRTWSQLKAERLATLKAKEASEKEKGTPASSIAGNGGAAVSEKDKEKEKKMEGAVVAAKKKWGGCPNGCDHNKHYYKKENSMHAMQLNGKQSPNTSPVTAPPESLPFRRPNARRWQSSSDEEEDDPRGHQIDVQRSLDEVVSSPDGTPSFISLEDRLRSRLKSPRNDSLLLVKHAGRDFGGSASGNTSQAGSDTEFSAEEDARKKLAKGKGFGEGLRITGMGGGGRADADPYSGGVASGGHGKGGRREESQMGRGVLADALGDQSDAGSEAEEELEEELEREEREDKSVQGSVY